MSAAAHESHQHSDYCQHHCSHCRKGFTVEELFHHVIVPVPFVGAALFGAAVAFGMPLLSPLSPFDAGMFGMGFAFLAAMYCPQRIGSLPRWAMAVFPLLAAAVVLAVLGLSTFGLATVAGIAVGLGMGLSNRHFAPSLGGSSPAAAAQA